MKIVTLIAVFLFSGFLFAAGPGKKGSVIRGKVSDTGHELLAGVKVQLTGTSISTYTDFEGNFMLFIPPGISQPELSFEMVSYQTLTKQVVPGSNREISIVLTEQQ